MKKILTGNFSVGDGCWSFSDVAGFYWTRNPTFTLLKQSVSQLRRNQTSYILYLIGNLTSNCRETKPIFSAGKTAKIQADELTICIRRKQVERRRF